MFRSKLVEKKFHLFFTCNSFSTCYPLQTRIWVNWSDSGNFDGYHSTDRNSKNNTDSEEIASNKMPSRSNRLSIRRDHAKRSELPERVLTVEKKKKNWLPMRTIEFSPPLHHQNSAHETTRKRGRSETAFWVSNRFASPVRKVRGACVRHPRSRLRSRVRHQHRPQYWHYTFLRRRGGGGTRNQIFRIEKTKKISPRVVRHGGRRIDASRHARFSFAPRPRLWTTTRIPNRDAPGTQSPPTHSHRPCAGAAATARFTDLVHVGRITSIGSS